MVQHGTVFIYLVSIGNFNTSNVMVQRSTSQTLPVHINQFQYIKCDGSASSDWRSSSVILLISIHQMWWFSNTVDMLWYNIIIFQYIKCDGSAPDKIRPWELKNIFQYIKCDGSALGELGAYGKSDIISIHQMWWFSGETAVKDRSCSQISIHQMWWFSRNSPDLYHVSNDISIHQMWWFSRISSIVSGDKPSFQYIKCDGSALYIVYYLLML